MDCIEGPKKDDGSCLLTIVDRVARKALIFKLKNQTQECVINVLDQIERKLERGNHIVDYNEMVA